MRWVHFIDTSVMANLLNLPGKNQRHLEAKEELRRLVRQKQTLILPIATVIETGNHIAHAGGSQRYQLAANFAVILRATARGEAPWEFGPAIDTAMLERIADALPQMVARGVGGADTSTKAAFEHYVATTPRVSVRVWSYDNDLAHCVHEEPEIGRK